jgi:hypothetical protein
MSHALEAVGVDGETTALSARLTNTQPLLASTVMAPS